MIKALMKKMKDQRGLTLVELLAVVVILGIISAIAVPSIGGIIQKAKIDAVKAEAIQVLNAGKLHLTADESATTISQTQLAPYLENIDLNPFSVKVVNDKITVTAEGEAGDINVLIYDATLEMLDSGNWTPTNKVITIGTAPTPTP